MRPCPVRSHVESLPLEEEVSFHAPVLIRGADHGVPEPHGEDAVMSESAIGFPATDGVGGRSSLQVVDFRDDVM